MVFELSTLNEHADPVAVLRGAHYPHGVRFASGDRHIVLADAGAPRVHVFASSDGGWHGVGYPTATIRVMDDDTFARGRHNPQEGGPKGIDVDPRTNVLVLTSACTPLSFFDLGQALEQGRHDGAGDALVRYELHVLADRELIRAETNKALANLRELQQTKAWRLTAPLRHAHEALARLRRR
jgi:DNA-binding beta-propeller fold protein YncE